jgi:hypothetical protein
MTEAESSLTDPKTLKASKSGKRTQDSPTTRRDETNQCSSLDKDKKRTRDLENLTIVPPSFHINQCTINPLTNPSGYPLPPQQVADYAEEAHQQRMAAIEEAIQEDKDQTRQIARRAEKQKATNDEEDISPPLTISPTPTEVLHPGYPYQEHTTNDHDIADIPLPRPYLQWLKKLSQCLAILKRLTWHKSSKLHNNLKIMYIILDYLGFPMNPRSCDSEQN